MSNDTYRVVLTERSDEIWANDLTTSFQQIFLLKNIGNRFTLDWRDWEGQRRDNWGRGEK